MELMARHNVRVHISDYSKAVPYAEKQAQVVRALMDSGVDYRVNESLVWTDFGFPDHPWRLSKEQAAAHMQSCAPVFRGLNSGRLYFCDAVCMNRPGRTAFAWRQSIRPVMPTGALCWSTALAAWRAAVYPSVNFAVAVEATTAISCSRPSRRRAAFKCTSRRPGGEY